MRHANGTTPADALVVDDEQVRLPDGLDHDLTYDILFNGQHVWSLQVGRDTTATEHGRVTPWPPALLPHLVGRAEVTLREHVEQQVVATTHHVFRGDHEREVSVQRADGHALVLDKYGRLIPPLSAADADAVAELMDHTERLLAVLQDKAGVPAFVCYGTLLGAVRDGRFIGHDNDLDLAYLSQHPHPVDVVREGYRVERVLAEEGFEVRRGAGTRLNVRLALADGTFRFIDVFTAHWVEGVLYMPQDTGFELPRETLLPLSQVSLMGRDVPAPADPERLLAATYGDGWRVPDPSFQYSTPRWLNRRLGGWFGGLTTNRKHWDGYYGKNLPDLPKGPTQLARWAAEHHPTTRPVLDLGTGNGRDALWFADKQGRESVGVDFSPRAVRRGQRVGERRGLSARFALVNLNDVRAALAWGAWLARQPEPWDIHARLTLNALDAPGRDNVVRIAAMALRRGGSLFLEFLTPDNDVTLHPHPWRLLDPDDVERTLVEAGGRVRFRTEGTGMAKIEGIDPHLCRMVVSWTEDREGES